MCIGDYRDKAQAGIGFANVFGQFIIHRGIAVYGVRCVVIQFNVALRRD